MRLLLNDASLVFNYLQLFTDKLWNRLEPNFVRNGYDVRSLSAFIGRKELGDKAATKLKSYALVAYPVYVGFMNCSERYHRRLIDTNTLCLAPWQCW